MNKRTSVSRAVRRTPIAALAVAIAACASGVTSSNTAVSASENSFVISNVRVFDGERVQEGMTVVVRDGIIAAVGRKLPAPAQNTFDGTGGTLIPGLFDAHAHVQDETSLSDALRFGVTTELDMLSRIEFDRTQYARRSRVVKTNLADLYAAGSPITSPKGLGTQFGIPFSTITRPEEAAAIVRSRIAEGSDYIKILYEPGAPLFTTISRETLAALVKAAHAEGVIATAHISSLQGARDAVDAGVDGLAHIMGDTVIPDELAREIARKHIFVSPTLSIIGAFQGRSGGVDLLDDPRLAPFLTEAQKKEVVKVGPGKDHPMAPYLVRFNVDRAKENVRRMRAAGVTILAGTDAPNLTSHGVSVHGELKLLVDAGLTPHEALTAATSAPAKAFRLKDRGVIAKGARADMVLVSGNPLTDITATRAIREVFKNGYRISRELPH